LITKVAAASSADLDKAVAAARKAFKTTWGLNCPGSVRGQLLNKFADLLEKNSDELAALEVLNTGELQASYCFVIIFLISNIPGKTLSAAKAWDMKDLVSHARYFAACAGKTYGKTVEVIHPKSTACSQT
jgi:aldehyde dehydrogenase (NAD+)